MDETFITRPLADGDFIMSNAAPSSSAWLNKTPAEILADVNALLNEAYAPRPLFDKERALWWEGVADWLPKWPERPTMFNPIFAAPYGPRSAEGMMMQHYPRFYAGCDWGIGPDRMVIPITQWYEMRFHYTLLSKMLRGRKTKRPARFTRILSKKWRTK